MLCCKKLDWILSAFLHLFKSSSLVAMLSCFPYAINEFSQITRILCRTFLLSSYSWIFLFSFLVAWMDLWLTESVCKAHFYFYVSYFSLSSLKLLFMCYPPKILSQENIHVTRIKSLSTRILKYIPNRLHLQDIK